MDTVPERFNTNYRLSNCRLPAPSDWGGHSSHFEGVVGTRGSEVTQLLLGAAVVEPPAPLPTPQTCLKTFIMEMDHSHSAPQLSVLVLSCPKHRPGWKALRPFEGHEIHQRLWGLSAVTPINLNYLIILPGNRFHSLLGLTTDGNIKTTSPD